MLNYIFKIKNYLSVPRLMLQKEKTLLFRNRNKDNESFFIISMCQKLIYITNVGRFLTPLRSIRNEEFLPLLKLTKHPLFAFPFAKTIQSASTKEKLNYFRIANAWIIFERTKKNRRNLLRF